MSSKPNPVALTAAMLTRRALQYPYNGLHNDPGFTWSDHKLADLASRLHRLAPAANKHAMTYCNGERFDGDRDEMHKESRRLGSTTPQALQFERAWNRQLAIYQQTRQKRIQKQADKLTEELKPLHIRVDYQPENPYNCALVLESTDAKHPLPRNGWDDGRWAL